MPSNWFEIIGFWGGVGEKRGGMDEQSLSKSHSPAGKGIPCWEVIAAQQPLLTP